MQQSGVGAFARLARWLAASAVLLLVSAGALAAQTGKLEGRVRDEKGAPIQNAQVIIVGTAFSALTNPQGYYFINNVPAGTIAVRASFIGFKRSEVEGVKILAGQTITQDIQLESSPVQVEDITVTAATNPLVPRDEVTTKQRIDGQATQNLPVDRVDAVVLLQPGVTPGGRSNGTLSIRGSRTDESAVYVDGVSVQSGVRGANGVRLTVGTNQFEQLQVTTGAASAEFGNAQGGIISFQSATGGAKLSARLAAESDEPFSKTTSNGFNRIEGNLSGPLGLKGLTFALGGAVEGNRFGGVLAPTGDQFPGFTYAGDLVDTMINGDVVKTAKYAVYNGRCDAFAGKTDSVRAGIADNYGQACEGARTLGSSSSYQASGNLNYSFGTGSRLRFTALASQGQARGYQAAFNTLGYQNGNRSWSRAYVLNWTQNLSKSSERAFAIDLSLSYQTDRNVNGPLQLGGAGKGTLGFYFQSLPFEFDFKNVKLDAAKELCFVTNDATCRGPIDLTNSALVNSYTTSVSQGIANPYGLATIATITGGGVGGIVGNTVFANLYKEDRYIARGNLDWQFDRYNRLKAGGEFTRYDIANYGHGILSSNFANFYAGKPRRAAAFIEDRLDLGDVIVVGGLRYDWYDSRAARSIFTDPQTGEQYFFPRLSTRTDLGNATDPRVLQVRDKTHNYLSPRIQVSFPVTEKTNFRLSYAHQVQSPDWDLIYRGTWADLNAGANTNQIYGGDLDFGKSILFEFGIRHAFSDDMVLDIAAYNKDNVANQAARLVNVPDPNTFDPNNPSLPPKRVDIRQMTNADFGNTRGIDLRLDRRFGQYFNGTVAYSYQDAKNTGSDPFTYANYGSRVLNALSGGNQPPPQAASPTDQSRPHNLAGAFALSFPNDFKQGSALGAILRNFSVFTTFRYLSGEAYTTCGTVGGAEFIKASEVRGGGCPRNAPFEDGINSARLPDQKFLDMRFVKGLKLGGSNLSFYLDARNILNFKNITDIFIATKDINSGGDFTNFKTDPITRFTNDAATTGVLTADNSADLRFSGAGLKGCSNWLGAGGAASCVNLVRAEARYGNGDLIFTQQEFENAVRARYDAVRGGPFNFYGAGRRLRLGVEVNF